MKSFKDPYWIKSGVFSLLQRFTIVLFGFIGFFILIRIFTKEEYGIWMLYMSFTSLTEVLRQGFIKNPLIKYINANEGLDRTKIVNASFFLNVILTTITVLFILAFSGILSSVWNAPGLDVILKLYVFTAIALTFFSHFEYILEANFDFKGVFIAYFVRQGLFLLYILFYAFSDAELSLINLAIAHIITTVISTLICYIYSRKKIVLSFLLDKEWMKKLFSFGKYTFGTNLSSMIMGNVDQWMLASLISPVSVAIYNPAIRITHLVDVPTMSVASIVFPKVASRIEKEGEKAAKYLFEKSVGLIMAIMVPALIFILLFADMVIFLVAGDKYAESVPILQVTILYSLFIPFGRQFGIIMDSMGLPKISFYFIIIKVIINIICNYIFIAQYGVIGAAWGTLASLSVGFILNMLFLKHRLDVKLLNIFHHMMLFYKDGFSFFVGYYKKLVDEKTLEN